MDIETKEKNFFIYIFFLFLYLFFDFVSNARLIRKNFWL